MATAKKKKAETIQPLYLFETRSAMELFIHENYWCVFCPLFVVYLFAVRARCNLGKNDEHYVYVKMWITQVFISLFVFVDAGYKSEGMQFLAKIASISNRFAS